MMNEGGTKVKRVILVVLDSFGIGEMPDAAEFGDLTTNTLGSVSKSSEFAMPNMEKLGFFNIEGIQVGNKTDKPLAAFARMREASKGKDTTIGHWEIAGVVSPNPLPTYPNGFPDDVIKEFEKRTGRKTICNKPYSGTKVIMDYGDEHVKTGDLIVYTSADSVFQIAAHEDVVPVEQLYEYCHIARELLQGEHGVGRVIARPFIGTSGNYERTPRRHDYSLEPPAPTMLNVLKDKGFDVLAVGKINDIFAGSGVTEYVYTTGNDDGMDKMSAWMERDFNGLLFVNLVDFDMLYGHRNNVDGYAKALREFDERLPEFLSKLGDDDVFMVTADHGCDPGYTCSTDHSREYTPFVMYGKGIEPKDYKTRESFADIAATVMDFLGVEEDFGAKAMK